MLWVVTGRSLAVDVLLMSTHYMFLWRNEKKDEYFSVEKKKSYGAKMLKIHSSKL